MHSKKVIYGMIMFVSLSFRNVVFADEPKKLEIYGYDFSQLEISRKSTAYPELKHLLGRRETVTQKDSSDSLRNIFIMFQESMKNYCIEQVDVSLAFDVNIKAWVVVTAGVSGSAKVIIKNTDKNCKS